MPPSYDEAVSSHQPSAPLMDGTPSHQTRVNAPGWNQSVNHAPVYPQLVQPTIQPQVHQTAAPPQQSNKELFYGLEIEKNQKLLVLIFSVVIINQQIQLNENPLCMMCPHCQQQTLTKVEFITSWMTHVMAGVLCLMW